MNGNFLPVIALAAFERDRRTRQRVIETAIPVALGGPMAPAFAAITAAQQQRSDTNDEARRDEQLAREAAATITTLAAKPAGQTLTASDLTAAAPNLSAVLGRINLTNTVLSAKLGSASNAAIVASVPATATTTRAATTPATTAPTTNGQQPTTGDPTRALVLAIAPYITNAIVDSIVEKEETVTASTPASLPDAVRKVTDELSAAVISAVQQQIAATVAGIGGAAQPPVSQANEATIDADVFKRIAAVLDAVNKPQYSQSGTRKTSDSSASIQTVTNADQADSPVGAHATDATSSTPRLQDKTQKQHK